MVVVYRCRQAHRRRSYARTAGSEDGSFCRCAPPSPPLKCLRSLNVERPISLPLPTVPLLYPKNAPHADISRLYIEVKTEDDLLPPGAEPGTVPTDLDQSTGLERFEILGKMQGIDVFDMRPLDASRKGMSDFILETGLE